MPYRPDFRRYSVATALAVMAVGFIGSAQAAHRERTLHKFAGGTDGSFPRAGLIADGVGSLYGTTAEGGSGTNCFEGGKYGCGTVFKITNEGAETILHAFSGGCDGALPDGGVIIDSQNNLYGTTSVGGNCNGGNGYGTVFELASGGAENVLYVFQGGSDGDDPLGNIVSDSDGNLFGTTAAGGNMAGCGGNGCGVVFEIPSAGGETVLHAFQGGEDGSLPYAGLMMDAAGNLFGTTSHGGGSTNCDGGCGTVFEVTPDGTESVLYAFQGGTDGWLPAAGVISNGAGGLYGTTQAGGGGGYGTVFEVTPGGSETVLYSFQPGSDGEDPVAALVMDNSGNLYGTTPYGGGPGCKQWGSCGTIFEVTTKGREKLLYTFRNGRGRDPVANLLLGAHGAIYGTTAAGGSGKNGVVFELMK